jgi:porphyrinogen peroxidase
MFIGNPPGTYDRVLDFSTAITGCLFYVPDADFLDDPPPAVAPAGATAAHTLDDNNAPAGGDAAGDGSLQIGSLREDRP